MRNTIFLSPFALVSVCMAMVVVSVLAQTKGNTTAQQMLDFLASPASASGVVWKDPALLNRFAEWSDEQKKLGFQKIVQRCALVNALEHDNPASRILPQPMTMREEAELAVSVCVPAKMPADWPDRQKYLDDAQRLIAKARSYGSTLHLPADLLTK